MSVMSQAVLTYDVIMICLKVSSFIIWIFVVSIYVNTYKTVFALCPVSGMYSVNEVMLPC